MELLENTMEIIWMNVKKQPSHAWVVSFYKDIWKKLHVRLYNRPFPHLYMRGESAEARLSLEYTLALFVILTEQDPLA